MFVDFDKVFPKHIDKLLNVCLSKNSPCNDCEALYHYGKEWGKVPHYVEHPPIEECINCSKLVQYRLQCAEKLKWYEEHDERLNERNYEHNDRLQIN